MQADTYIPRRLDDQWKIGFWDVDVAAAVPLRPLRRLPVRHQGRLRALRRVGPADVALGRAHQGRQAPGLRDALGVLAPADQSADGDARHAALPHPPHGRLKPARKHDHGLRTSQRRPSARCAGATGGLGLTVALLAGGHLLALVVILNLLGTVRTSRRAAQHQQDVLGHARQGQHRVPGADGRASSPWLVLDVSPATIDWKRNVLLGYVAPDRHGELKTQQELEAERLRASTPPPRFCPSSWSPATRTSRSWWSAPAHDGNGLDVGDPRPTRSTSTTPAAVCT